ncbi:MAG: metallophosphoesterase [Fibrella sp.]|nr:metallophosphoesterase [Armatimonadota bacterium]
MIPPLKRREFLQASLALAATVPAAASARNEEPKRDTLRVALIADTHTTRATKEDQALYIPRFEAVIKAVNAATPDLILFAGDLTQNGKPDEITDFLALSKRLRAPMRWVPGNHDVGAKHLPGKASGTSAARNEAYEKSFGSSYFADDVAGVRVVGINTSVLGSGLPTETEQWRFLDRSLGGNAIRDAKPTIILLHYPPYLKDEKEPGGDYWNIEPEPRARLLKLLDGDKTIRTVLSGHLHYPIAYTRGNALYHTSAPVSFGLPRGKQPQGWTMITVPLANKLAQITTAQFHPILDKEEPKS